MIRFTCECGKQLQAREESAGKPVLCPACKRQLIVPQPEVTAIVPEVVVDPAPAEARVQRQAPAVRDETDFEDEERPRRPRPEGGSSGKAIASLVLGIVSLCGCTCFAGLPSILLGILSLRDIGRAAGSLTGKPMAIIGIVLGSLGTLCWPIVGIPGYFITQSAAEQTQAQNNLRQLGLAMHSFNDAMGRLPASDVGNLQNPFQIQPKPMLSWRVALLPYIEEVALYKQFKFDEPWDGPNNIKLLARMPKVYKLPGDTTTPSDHTCFQVFVGNGAAFEKKESMRFPASFADGLSNTILIAVAAKGVPWTKPEDIPFNPNQPIAPLLNSRFRSGYLVLLGDGSVRILSRSISENTLKAAITRNGGEVLGADW